MLSEWMSLLFPNAVGLRHLAIRMLYDDFECLNYF